MTGIDGGATGIDGSTGGTDAVSSPWGATGSAADSSLGGDTGSEADSSRLFTTSISGRVKPSGDDTEHLPDRGESLGDLEPAVLAQSAHSLVDRLPADVLR